MKYGLLLLLNMDTNTQIYMKLTRESNNLSKSLKEEITYKILLCS